MKFICMALVAFVPWAPVPGPQSIDVSRAGGYFELTNEIVAVVADDATDEEVYWLKRLIGASNGGIDVVRASEHSADWPGIYVGEVGRHASFDDRKMKTLLRPLKPVGPHGYRLIVRKDKVLVAGSDATGTFYGLQSLAQMFRDLEKLPAFEIRDEPDLGIRGLFVEGTLPRTKGDASDWLDKQMLLRCNLIVFSSADFMMLDNNSSLFWSYVFDEARRRRIEPVPYVAFDDSKTNEEYYIYAGDVLAQIAGELDADIVFIDLKGNDQPAKQIVKYDGLLKRMKPGARLMVPDSVMGSNSGRLMLPSDVILAASVREGESWRDTVERCESFRRGYALMPRDGRTNLYKACEAGGDAKSGRLLGVVSVTGAFNTPLIQLAMDKSWSVSSPKAAWPAGFSDYYGVDLWEPVYEETLQVMVEHLNERTLSGVAPSDERANFDRMLVNVRAQLPEDEFETAFVEGLYHNLVDYVRLESGFGKASKSRRKSIVAELAGLVENQATYAPDMDPARASGIVQRVRSDGAFVPSSILFGEFVFPFREMAIPESQVLLETLAKPVYIENAKYVDIVYDFLTCPGPIYRLDFETAGAGELEISKSADGHSYEMVERVSADSASVMGPILLDKTFESRFMRIRALGNGRRQVVLKNSRVFALKGPARGLCRRSSYSPMLDGSFKDRAWMKTAVEATARGFVREDGAGFAEAQSNVRLCYTDKALYVAAWLREPLIETMQAEMRESDSPLWDEESFECVVQAGDGSECRFLINPAGTLYDSKGGDVSWDGTWRAVPKMYSTGWAVEMMLPFKDLKMTAGQGVALKINFLRSRGNINKERSAWSFSADGAGVPPGEIVLD